MPINWGMLQPVGQGSGSHRVIGSGSSSVQSASGSGPGVANDIGQGLSSFADAYNKKRQLDMQERQVNMAEKLGNLTAQEKQMEIAQKQKDMEITALAVEAYNKNGMKGYIETLQKNGKINEALGTLKAQQELTNFITDGKISLTKLSQEELKLASEKMNVIGTGLLGIEELPPEQRQQAQAAVMKGIEDTYGITVPEAFKQYNPITNMLAIGHVKDLSDRLKNNPYLLQKVSPTIQKNIKSTEKNPYNEALGKAEAKRTVELADKRLQMDTFLQFAEQAQKQLQGIPGYSLGPIASSLKLDKMDPQTQVLNSTLSAMTALAKDIVGLKGGAQGMTEGEWEMIKSIAGGTFMNKYSLQEVLETIEKASRLTQRRTWNEEDKIRSQDTPDAYERWKEQNPKPKLAKQEDIEHTAKQHNMSVEQVEAELEKNTGF